MKPNWRLWLSALLLFLTGCAHQLPPYEKPLPQTAIEKVRTTAYTHSEKGHHRYGNQSALGTPLKYGAINSAAADWARWPAGTRFRIKTTGEIFEIDDYGFALAGTNTIDLYKPTRKAMQEWGVRRVTIQILQWGNPVRSYLLLAKVKSYRHIRRMLKEMKKVIPNQQPQPCKATLAARVH
ncbi:MAG: 3D domain-containing protein [Chthoniobacterales bacterium]|nr:3D domain-containing protein [Chthoniobacterales bacterium]